MTGPLDCVVCFGGLEWFFVSSAKPFLEYYQEHEDNIDTATILFQKTIEDSTMHYTLITFILYLFLITILQFSEGSSPPRIQLRRSMEVDATQFYSFITTTAQPTLPWSNDRPTKLVQMFHNQILGHNINNEVIVQRTLMKSYLENVKRTSTFCPHIPPDQNNEVIILEHYKLIDPSEDELTSSLVLRKVVRQAQHQHYDFPEVSYFDSSDSVGKGRVMVGSTTDFVTQGESKQIIHTTVVREYKKQFGKAGRNIPRKVTETERTENTIVATITGYNITRYYDWYETNEEATSARTTDTALESIPNLVEVRVLRDYCSGHGKRAREQWYEYYFLAHNIPILVETHYPSGPTPKLETVSDSSCSRPQKRSVISMPVGSASKFTTAASALAMTLLALILTYYIM